MLLKPFRAATGLVTRRPREGLAYMISGKWGYLEHDRAVSAPRVWLSEKGESTGYYDVHNYTDMCREHYAKAGIGSDFVETLFR